jgi:prepilin-type N-terminal cleavage/methylation domain-containing protein
MAFFFYDVGWFIMGICKNNGFTLIELMIVVAVIGILAAIAIPNFLGMQEKARRRAVSEAAWDSKGDLHNWLIAASKNQRGVVDVNGDGLLNPGELHTNKLTVPDSWIQAMYTQKGKTLLSPWDQSKDLFLVGAVPGSGQITFSMLHNGMGIKITALDRNSNVIFKDSVSIE